jgi:hypothetical protein
VILVAAIHDSTARPARMFTLVAFGWTLIMATLTITVHFVELTVARRLAVPATPGFHACSASNGHRCSWRSNFLPGICSSG